jgi:hypothetical protein
MKKKNLFLSLVVVANTVVLGAGCSALKNMDDMKNTTGQMANTTKQMAGTTQGMAKTTDEVRDGVEQTLTDLRQGNTLQARQDSIIQLNNATSMEAKIAAATAYFEAFEFQLWGVATDTRDTLISLYLCAIQEFDRDVKDYVPEDMKVDPTSKNNKTMNLYALSVTMHMLNGHAIPQPMVVGEPKIQVSMFDLIKNGLNLKAGLDSGKIQEASLEDWQREVLNNEQLYDYIIQTRENFLPVMTLAQVSNIAQTGFLGIPGLLREGKMLFFDWNPSLSSMNIEQISRATSWLKEANEDRDYLNTIHVDARVDSSVKKIYEHMDLSDAKPSSDQSNATTARLQDLTSFKSIVQEFLKTDSN